MTDPAVVTALGSPTWETALVAQLAHPGTAVRLQRRCVDVVDVMSATSAGAPALVLLGADLPGLNADAVARISQYAPVVGLASDELARQLLLGWGVASVSVLNPERPAEAVAAIIARLGERPRTAPATEAVAKHRGRLTAIWGPQGAPGRSTFAMALADACGHAGRDALLVDADTRAPALAFMAGCVDESSGLVAASRMAERSGLSPAALVSVCRRLPWQRKSTVALLSGIGDPGRWHELRPGPLSRVWTVSRQICDDIIVDCGAITHAEDVPDVDIAALPRECAGMSAIAACDLSIGVAAAEPLSLRRMLALVITLRDSGHRPDAIVLTKSRASVLGRNELNEAKSMLSAASGIEPIVIPDDRDALDRAMSGAGSLRDSPRCKTIKAADVLVAELAGRGWRAA